MKKRFLSVVLACSLTAVSLAGCGLVINLDILHRHTLLRMAEEAVRKPSRQQLPRQQQKLEKRKQRRRKQSQRHLEIFLR